MAMEWLRNFFTGWPLNAALAVLAVIGFVLSIVFYFKQKKDRRPRWDSFSVTVISSDKPEAEVLSSRLTALWDGNPIEQLSITRILIGNAGREVIRREDVATADPVRIELADGGQVLACQVVDAPQAVNLSLVIQGPTRVAVAFDHLDKGDAAVIRVVHTGRGRNVSVKGTVIGGGQWEVCRDKTPRWLVRTILGGAALAFVVLVYLLKALFGTSVGKDPMSVAILLATGVTLGTMVAAGKMAKWLYSDSIPLNRRLLRSDLAARAIANALQ